MRPMDALTEQQIEQALTDLPGWEFDGEVITKTYVWGSFRESIDFVNDVADLAEDANHHPDLEIYFDERVLPDTQRRGGDRRGRAHGR